MSNPQSLLVLVGSPRRSGNSAALAAAVQRGTEQAGTRVALRFIDDHISSFLRDCRTCRRADGECAIGDGYRTLFFDDFLPAGVIERMSRKRIALVLASEETYPGASLGIVHQIQEYSRYTHSEFVGVVRGVGNSRSEVVRDPGEPLLAAEQLGREMFTRRYSDFRLDTQRSGRVWPQEDVQS
ncbi:MULTISPECIES: hypothetical protein [unclassified Cyanobium]|uniref:hypothetical protein n=1 Tax=unclassified Cyanobium TaxID=2627006 RepID=UPI0020CE7AFA|nr:MULTISPECIES: hypothetical protein [unclassified Cyanobium]MCP9835788.1 flavodoxin family protein [Cyanobium sp. La Preciosa 7G6]MCP9938554.1 flavodoxin family protein [Cyanobium sp. Aljojuca 7A6]